MIYTYMCTWSGRGQHTHLFTWTEKFGWYLQCDCEEHATPEVHGEFVGLSDQRVGPDK